MRLRPVNDGWYHVLPFVAGQGHQFGEVAERLGGQADVGGFVQHHLGHLLGRALVQAHSHLGKFFAQGGDRLRQHVARLGVRGRDRQGACVLQGVFVANAPEVAHFAQDQVNRFEHLLPGLGDPLEPLAMAHEDVHAQLFFQLQDGFRDAGLRGVQRLGGLGQVEVAASRFVDKPELVQVHVARSGRVRCLGGPGPRRCRPRPG